MEKIKTYSVAGLFWLASLLFTLIIFYFYLESMNIIELKYGGPRAMPVLGLYLETNPENFSEAVGEQLRINIANVMLIFLTPALNLVIAFMIHKKVRSKFALPSATPAATTPTPPTPSSTTPATPPPAIPTMPNLSHFTAFDKSFGMTDSKAKLLEYLGVDNVANHVTLPGTNADVKAGTTTRKELIDEMSRVIFKGCLEKFISSKNRITSTINHVTTELAKVTGSLDPAVINSMNSVEKNTLKITLKGIISSVADVSSAHKDGDKAAKDVVMEMAKHGFSLTYNKELDATHTTFLSRITPLNLESIVNSL
jgi:hypothetical protein